MRSRLASCALLSTMLLFAANAFAKAEHHRFSFDECEQYLGETTDYDSASRDKAAEIEDWIAFRHPVLRGAAARAKSLEAKYDLLFLATGYMVPPSHDAMIEQYARVARFRYGQNRISRYLLRDLSRAIMQNTGYDEKMRREFVVSILQSSLFILNALVEHRDTLRPDVLEIGTPSKCPRLHLDAWSSFTRADTLRMGEMLGWLEESPVRHALVDRIVGRSKSLLIDQDKLYVRLQNGRTAGDFDRIVQQVSPVEIPRIGSTAATPAKIATEVREFIAARADRAGRKVEDVALADLLRDLHTAAGLLNSVLGQVQTLRSKELDPSAWRSLLDGSRDSIERFNDAILDSESYAFEVMSRIESAERVLEELAAWLNETNAFVVNLRKTESHVARLRSHDQNVLKSIVTTLPAQLELMNGALTSIRLHRDRLLGRLSVIATFTNVLGHAMERRLSQETVGDDLLDTPEYQTIVTTLDGLVNGGSRVE